MSYAQKLTPRWGMDGLHGLGGTNSAEVAQMTVGPGATDSWLDAAITPHGIPSVEADRVPDAIKRTLQQAGSNVRLALWGGGEGYESTRGRIYVMWKADKPYNAVDYADIARRIFAAAAEGFPAGAQLVMNRYRILTPSFYRSTLPSFLRPDPVYVYPVGGPVPASAPEVARRSSVANLPLPSASDEPAPGTEADFARFARQVGEDTGIPVWGWGLIGGGAILTIGGAVYLGTRRARPAVAKNRRRRHR